MLNAPDGISNRVRRLHFDLRFHLLTYPFYAGCDDTGESADMVIKLTRNHTIKHKVLLVHGHKLIDTPTGMLELRNGCSENIIHQDLGKE